MDENKSEFFGDIAKSSGNTEDAFKQNFMSETASISVPAAQAYTPRPPPVIAVMTHAI